MGTQSTVNGVIITATTGSNTAPQIVYGTTTINVSMPIATTSADLDVGGYIMSGIGGLSSTVASPSAPLQVTTNAARIVTWQIEVLVIGFAV